MRFSELLENNFKENANTSEYRQQIFKIVVISENYICTIECHSAQVNVMWIFTMLVSLPA